MKKSKKQAFYASESDGQVRIPANDDIPSGRVPSLKAQTANQRHYLRTLHDESSTITVAYGPAGTGKTYIATIEAIRALQAKKIKKIIITRPMVYSDGEELGILPGGIIEKVSPWMIPILDIFKEVYSVQQVTRMLEEETVEIAPLAIMRGRTLKNAIIIGDEMQNATVKQMLMFLSRIGEGSRIVVTGDPDQHDRGEGTSGLVDLLTRLDGDPQPGINVVEFGQEDVVRHEVVSQVLRLYA